MMTQSYHGGDEFDPKQRTAHRNMGSANFYDRPAPYGYYEPLGRHGHDLRQEYTARMPIHASIQEPDEPLTAGGQARRRIAVAVSAQNLLCKQMENLTTLDVVCTMPKTQDQMLRRPWRWEWVPGL